MKKTLAILLALALVFSSVTVAFAAETLPVDVQACSELKMLEGANGVVTADYAKTAPTRIQAAVMVLRLKGLEADAKAFAGTDNFADADQAAWAKPIMAYLKATPTVGFGGVGNNAFNPNGLMDAKSYYKVMLETLGYVQGVDFTWENVVAFAATKGLTKVAGVASYTIGDLATATIEALMATTKSGKTLATTLVEAGKMDAAAAEKAGVYKAPVVTLAIESVKAVNLKETVVTFTKEVDEDSAEDVDNYQLDDEDMNAEIDLNDDKKSVTITWDAGSELDNQTEYDLTVDGVADVAGAELEEVTVTFLANDVTLPVAQSLKLVGPNKLKLTFTEPIAVEGEIEVTDKDYDYEVAEVVVDGDEVTIELSDDELVAGNYSVEVKGFADYADLKNLKKTFTLAYAKDTTAPVATIKKATQSYVEVEFNKPVYNGDAAEAAMLGTDFFYHTYTSFEPVMVSTSDNEVYTVYFTVAAANAALEEDEQPLLDPDDFTDRPLPEGNVKFVVLSEGDDEDLTDEWGNVLKNDIVLTVTIAADVTAPTVTEVEVDDQTTILVHFSEDVAVEADNFSIVDEDGEDVDIADVTYSNDDDEFIATLTFEDPLEGDYSLTVEDVVDLALEDNEIVKVTKKFAVADETAPDLAEVTVIGVDENDDDESDFIYVTFPEDMATTGTYSVLNKDNYQIFDGEDYFDLEKDDKIVTFNGTDKIKITIADSTVFNVEDGSVELVIGRVADALGNKVSVFNVPVEVAAEESPVITEVKTLSEKTIEITIDGELKAVNKAYITVSHDGADATPLYSIKSWKVDDGETIIVGVLTAAQYLDDAADIDLVVSVEADKFKTISGTPMDEFTFGDDEDEEIEDGYAPSITDEDDIEVTGEGTFEIFFDELLIADDAKVALFAQDLVVKNKKGEILVAGDDYETTLGEDGVSIVVTITQDEPEEGNYKVYSNSTIKYIKDAAGNKANAFTTSVTLEDLIAD